MIKEESSSREPASTQAWLAKRQEMTQTEPPALQMLHSVPSTNWSDCLKSQHWVKPSVPSVSALCSPPSSQTCPSLSCLKDTQAQVCPASGLSLMLFLGSFSFCLLYFWQEERAASCFSQLTPSHLYFIETISSKAFAVSSELSPSAFSQSPSISILPDTEHTLTSAF